MYMKETNTVCSTQTCPITFLQSPEQSMHFCQCCMSLEPSATETYSSISQPAMHSFLDCMVDIGALPSHIFVIVLMSHVQCQVMLEGNGEFHQALFKK